MLSLLSTDVHNSRRNRAIPTHPLLTTAHSYVDTSFKVHPLNPLVLNQITVNTRRGGRTK